MPMTEEQVKLHTHLMMLENFIAMLFASELRPTLSSTANFNAFRDALLDKARQEAFPGTDPSMSHHIAGEYEQHVKRMLLAIETKLGLRSDE